jgi:hypothetical protein
MEFLVLLHPVLIIIFVAVSSVVLAFLLQQGEDVIDSAFSRRVVSRTIYQLPGRVAKTHLQPSFHRISSGVLFNSRSFCLSAGGPSFVFFLFLPQPEEQAASPSSWGPSSGSWGPS